VQTETKPIHLALEFVVYTLVFSPALIAAAIFIKIMTTPAATDAGVAGGGGALSSRKTIAWDEVQRIDCDLEPTARTITLLRIVAPGKRIELSGGSDLTYVRDYIWARVPHHALRSCSVPFSSQRRRLEAFSRAACVTLTGNWTIPTSSPIRVGACQRVVK
jgi:hypothetical protein